MSARYGNPPGSLLQPATLKQSPYADVAQLVERRHGKAEAPGSIPGFGSSNGNVCRVDETWGLTWSMKWHAIDPQRSDSRTVSRCGAYLYTQAEVRDSGHLRHLKAVLADPASVPACKRCEKSLANAAR